MHFNSLKAVISRAANVRLALRLGTLTIVWMVIEALGSVGAGVIAGSLLLMAFGVDSVIELISACLLLGRLRKEEEVSQDDPSVEVLEQKVSRTSGYLLYALSAYVVLQVIYGLTHQHKAETSWLGMAIAFAAAFGIPILARAKIRVADQIGSRVLRADAMETFTCGYLSWVLLAGLAVNALLHWWWLDAAASLVIVPFLLKEAREAFRGECGCHDE